MPKTGAERARIHIALKRKHARAAGLCANCCNTKPRPGRSICDKCNALTAESVKRKRQRDRETAELKNIVYSHEKEGDKARTYHLFDSAAQHYQEALNVTAIAPEDRKRIAEKLGSVFLLTSNPAATNTWRARVLDSYRGDTAKVEKTIQLLLATAMQMWIDLKVRESIALCQEAVRLAEKHGTSRLHKLAALKLANHLSLVGRFDDAAQHLGVFGGSEATDDLMVRAGYHWRKGFIAAMRGLMVEAYDNLERAVHYAKETNDLFNIVGVLDDYAVAAIALGELPRAKALLEQVLLTARRNHTGWLVPQTCMGYAHILAQMGQYTNAYGYLLEALSSDASVPLVEGQFVSVGIPIALHLNDEATLAKCIRPAAIDLAFQSGEPARVGPVVSAFARCYVHQGQRQEARMLLHRALEVVTYVDESIDLPIVVAQYGAQADIPAARALLEARMRLPSARVAQACLLLFDALVGQRTGQEERPNLATEAAEQFDRLQWYAYSDLARSLIPLPHPIATASARMVHEQTFSSALPALTERERQVVELVLKGYTNRAIAQQLTIREHTVEKHMGNIMSRLGIRSRHQLVDAIA